MINFIDFFNIVVVQNSMCMEEQWDKVDAFIEAVEMLTEYR